MNDSKMLSKTQCPKCASSGGDNSGDNLAVYDDGHGYCFACEYYQPSGAKVIEEKVVQIDKKEKVPVKDNLVKNGSYMDLKGRGITKATCEKYGYQVGTFSGKLKKDYVQGETVHIANYSVVV
jgi:twinkle protein